MMESVQIKTETVCKEEIELIDISGPSDLTIQVKSELNREASVHDKDKQANGSKTGLSNSAQNKTLINLNGVLYLVEKIPETLIRNGQPLKVVPKVIKNRRTLLDTDYLWNVCPQCNTSMAFHTRECHKCGSLNRWQCKKCKRHFKSLPDARCHWKMICNPEEYYHCLECDYRSPKKLRMDLHIVRAHPELNESDIPKYTKKRLPTNSDAHVCSKCGMKFKDERVFNRHRHQCQKKRKKIQSFANLSGKDTSLQSIEFIMRHCQTCKIDVELKELQGPLKSSCSDCSSTLVYKCMRCGELHEHYDAVVSHVNMLDDCQKQIRCTECSYTTFSKLRFETHQKRSHGDISATCTNCGSYFRKLTLFERHVAYCGISTTLNCKMCPFITSKSEYLKRHINVTHKRRSPVKMINVTRRTRSAFEDVRPNIQTFCIPCHRRQTMNYRAKFCKICNSKLEFRCIVCDKMYQLEDPNACEHVKSYLNWISRECKQCGKGFITNKRLKIHEEWCGKTKSFNCKLCIYSTRYVKYLRAHERKAHPNAVPENLHEGIPSSENDNKTESEKINSRKKTLKLSLQNPNVNRDDSTSHKDTEEYQCTHCPYRTTIQSQLTKHKKRMHEINNVVDVEV